MSHISLLIKSKENEPANDQDCERGKTVLPDPDAQKNEEDVGGSSSHGSWNFCDTDCGEAFHVQRLDIDFTPDEVDEDPILLKKCNEFWNLIRNQPYLMSMAVNTEGPTSSRSSTSIETVKNEDILSDKGQEAMQWLQYKDAVKRSFASREKQNCDKSEHHSDRIDPIKEHDKETSRKADKKGLLKDVPGTLETSSKSYVKYLCDEMEEWDLNHPKSMEPPGHSPSICDTPTSSNQK